MKNFILFLLFSVVSSPKISLACSCLAPSSFCESITESDGSIYADLILRGKATTGNSSWEIDIEINDLIYGDLNKNKISIKPDMCTLGWSKLEIGQEYIFALKKRNDVFNIIGCSIFFLKIENEIVKGKIAPGIESIAYNYIGSLESCGNILGNFSLKRNIIVFPNPTFNDLKIINTSATENYEKPTLKIFDIKGRELQAFKKVDDILPEEAWIINIQHLSKGLYLIKLFDKSDENTFKIVKQ